MATALCLRISPSAKTKTCHWLLTSCLIWRRTCVMENVNNHLPTRFLLHLHHLSKKTMAMMFLRSAILTGNLKRMLKRKGKKKGAGSKRFGRTRWKRSQMLLPGIRTGDPQQTWLLRVPGSIPGWVVLDFFFVPPKLHFFLVFPVDPTFRSTLLFLHIYVYRTNTQVIAQRLSVLTMEYESLSFRDTGPGDVSFGIST